MSNFKRKNVKQMSIKELDDYIKTNSKKNFSVDKNNNTYNPNDENNIFSNILNYNYLDNQNNQVPDRDINDYKEKEIELLLKENRELKVDIKKLFFFTDQNKNKLEIKIKELSDENFKLKQEINELKNKLILQENILTNSEVDKHEIINEKKIMKDRYDNEIKELNCQLNNYKSKLNYLNFEYQNLLENFHKLKQESIFYESRRRNPYVNKIYEEKKQYSIDNTRNNIDNNHLNNISNEYLNKTNYSNEGPNKINKKEENNISKNSKSNTSINNSSKKLKRSKTTFQKKNIKKSKSNLKNKNYNNILRIKKKSVKKNSPNKKNHLLISDSKVSSKRFLTSYNNSDSNKTLKIIDEEIFNLEKKINELNISYQQFLQNLKQIPDNNFKESEDLKNTLKYLQETIEDKNRKLKELKFKQQKFLIQSSDNN